MNPSPSAMMPSGARCTRPSAPAVVTMVSRIIGIELALRLRSAQRVSGFAQPGQIFRLAVDRAAPVERLLLGVAVFQPPGDLRLGHLGAEIERMRGVALDPQPVKHQ